MPDGSIYAIKIPYSVEGIFFSNLLTPTNDCCRKKVWEQRHLPMAEQFNMLLKQINEKEHYFNKIAVPTSEGFGLIPADQVIKMWSG